MAALPLPSPGDLFLDFEGDPFAFDQGLEYPIRTVSEKNFEFRIADFEFKDKELGRENFGLREKKFEVRNLKSEIHYEGLWSFNRGEEKRAFEQFIGSVMERRRQYPGMHIYLS